MANGQISELKRQRLENALKTLFFEKQDGALCGQHCLNNAVQYRVFSAVELSTIAQQLDDKERQTMAECGTHTQEYRDFINKPSHNFDDTGYFSVQVLSEALKNLGLELVPFRSDDERAAYARQNPLEQRLLICNMEDHWFSLRRFGNKWVNLNSTLTKPEAYTDTYFTLFLSTLESDGHSLFLVFGNIPENAEAEAAFSNLLLNAVDDDADAFAGHGNKLGGTEPSSDSVSQEDTAKRENVRLQREAFLRRLEGTQKDCSS